MSNSSEQDEQEEILEIAAIYEAICDPLPPFLLTFFFRLSRKWREGSGPPGDIRPTTNPFTTLREAESMPLLLHLLSLSKDFFPCTRTMEMDCAGDGCQGWRTLGHMDEDREEDDICYLSVGGISLICFLSLVLHYYCEPVLQYCEPELE